MLKGISGIPGVPLDVSARMGMHNLIPGTAILKQSEKDKMRDVQEIIGPVGGVLKAGGTAAEMLAQGKYGEAGKQLMPTALQNIFKAIDMAQTGQYRDTQGRKIADVSATETALKGLGFQPNQVARESDAMRTIMQDRNLHTLKEDAIADKWARGVLEKDPALVNEARQDLKDWNEKNPETPIRIKFSQVASRVKAAKQSREQRIIKSTAPELRAQARREIAER
jgi:hypothetical protein